MTPPNPQRKSKGQKNQLLTVSYWCRLLLLLLLLLCLL
jgi:hypothetical protein